MRTIRGPAIAHAAGGGSHLLLHQQQQLHNHHAPSGEGLAPLVTAEVLPELTEDLLLNSTSANCVLRCTNGVFSGRFLYVNRSGEVLGSGNTQDVSMFIQLESLSPRHAAINFDPVSGSYNLVDLASASGTWMKLRKDYAHRIWCDDYKLLLGAGCELEVQRGAALSAEESFSQFLVYYEISTLEKLLLRRLGSPSLELLATLQPDDAIFDVLPIHYQILLLTALSNVKHHLPLEDKSRPLIFLDRKTREPIAEWNWAGCFPPSSRQQPLHGAVSSSSSPTATRPIDTIHDTTEAPDENSSLATLCPQSIDSASATVADSSSSSSCGKSLPPARQSDDRSSDSQSENRHPQQPLLTSSSCQTSDVPPDAEKSACRNHHEDSSSVYTRSDLTSPWRASRRSCSAVSHLRLLVSPPPSSSFVSPLPPAGRLHRVSLYLAPSSSRRRASSTPPSTCRCHSTNPPSSAQGGASTAIAESSSTDALSSPSNNMFSTTFLGRSRNHFFMGPPSSTASNQSPSSVYCLYLATSGRSLCKARGHSASSGSGLHPPVQQVAHFSVDAEVIDAESVEEFGGGECPTIGSTLLSVCRECLGAAEIAENLSRRAGDFLDNETLWRPEEVLGGRVLASGGASSESQQISSVSFLAKMDEENEEVDEGDINLLATARAVSSFSSSGQAGESTHERADSEAEEESLLSEQLLSSSRESGNDDLLFFDPLDGSGGAEEEELYHDAEDATTKENVVPSPGAEASASPPALTIVFEEGDEGDLLPVTDGITPIPLPEPPKAPPKEEDPSEALAEQYFENHKPQPENLFKDEPWLRRLADAQQLADAGGKVLQAEDLTVEEKPETAESAERTADTLLEDFVNNVEKSGITRAGSANGTHASPASNESLSIDRLVQSLHSELSPEDLASHYACLYLRLLEPREVKVARAEAWLKARRKLAAGLRPFTDRHKASDRWFWNEFGKPRVEIHFERGAYKASIAEDSSVFRPPLPPARVPPHLAAAGGAPQVYPPRDEADFVVPSISGTPPCGPEGVWLGLPAHLPHRIIPGDTVYLSSLEFSVLRYNVGIGGQQGCRATMEDEETVMQHFEGLSRHIPSSFFAVYDGHGGRECALFVREELHNAIKEHIFRLSGGLDTVPFAAVAAHVHDALRSGFIVTDQMFLSRPVAMSQGGKSGPGCAAVAAIILGESLWCAHCGDARGVLSRAGVAVQTSVDHKPDRPDEQDRIIRAGGFVKNKRVVGRLAVSRAFGDADYKAVGTDRPPLVIPDPEIRHLLLLPEDEFFLLACDGLFDVFSSQDAVNFCRSRLANMPKDEQDPQRVVQDLIHEAIETRKSRDNVTAILITFQRHIV